MLASSGTFGEAEDAFIGIDCGDIVTGVDCGGGVGNQVVSHVAEGLHLEEGLIWCVDRCVGSGLPR